MSDNTKDANEKLNKQYFIVIFTHVSKCFI